MRDTIVSVLGAIKGIIDLMFAIYVTYIAIMAFRGGEVWGLGWVFDGGIANGLIWLFLILPIGTWLFDLVLSLLFFSVLTPFLLLLSRDDTREIAATAEPLPDYSKFTGENQVTLANQQPAHKYYYGFGGWLILLTLGLLLTFGQSLFYLLDSLYPMFTDGTIQQLIDYDRSWGIIIFMEFFIHIFIVFSIILIGIFCLKQLKIFKTSVISFLVVSFIFSIVAYFVYLSNPDTAVDSSTQLENIFRQFVYGAIWIPYMLLSKRVKNTFIK